MQRIFKDLSESQIPEVLGCIRPFIKNKAVLVLCGDLGAGKTTFARALIRDLTGIQKVVSPTFNLVQVYEGRNNKVWHYDLYRVKHSHELEELAIEDALNDIVIIEWYDIAKPYLPEEILCITIAFTDDDNNRNLRNFKVSLISNDANIQKEGYKQQN